MGCLPVDTGQQVDGAYRISRKLGPFDEEADERGGEREEDGNGVGE